jgi:FMN reductase/FAD reductase [NAD(P)H]
MKLLAIQGTVISSKPLVLIREVLAHVRAKFPAVETEVLDIRDYRLEFCDGRSKEQYNEDTRKAITLIESADAYLVGTPIIHGSLPGTLKNLLDLVSPEAFRNKVMAFVAAGGNNQHYLAVENQLKPIAGYLQCLVAPQYVYAHKSHFNEKNEIIDPEIARQIEVLADQIGKLSAVLADN